MDEDDHDHISARATLPIVSDSPEDLVRRCPSAGEPKSDSNSDSDSDSSEFEAFPVESTEIFMVSPPDSLEQKDGSSTPHVYQTPPEELASAGSDGQRSVAVDVHPSEDMVGDHIGAKVTDEYMEDEKAVDLGRDTNVGFRSEVQSTREDGEMDKLIQNIAVYRSQISGSKAKNFELPELCREESGECESSSSKRLKLSEEALASSPCKRTVVENFPVDSNESGGGSKVMPASSVDHNDEMTEELPMEMNSGNEDFGGKCEAKGMDDGEVSNGEIHCNYEEKSAEKEVREEEGVESSQPDEPSEFQEEMADHDQSSRVLPPSVGGVKDNAGKKMGSSDESTEVTVLDILKILKGEEECGIDDENLSKLSILDIAQLRGMTLPRPDWWPPEY